MIPTASLALREARAQAFADTFLTITMCLIGAMMLIPLMRSVTPPSSPSPDAH